MLFTEITDDLTGAADSGSYFTDRSKSMRIYLSGEGELEREGDELVSVNLSSRNVEGSLARKLHFDLCKRLPVGDEYIFMKKIGTGFRGNDAFELEGMLAAQQDYVVFIIDNAPDLGTFTLYGNQYCEGQILHKSLYAKDPIMPPKQSYIPDILAKDTDIKIGLVDIDAVKGGRVLQETGEHLKNGARIVVFDAITKEDTLKIISTLQPVYKKVFWTGSLGIADALAQYLYGDRQPRSLPKRDVRCMGFCASAYEIAQQQLEYSRKLGLELVHIDVDAYIDGDKGVVEKSIAEALLKNASGNVMIVPEIKKYSYSPGASEAILKCIRQVAAVVCQRARFDRLVIVGGETAQTVFDVLGTRSISLDRQIQTGVAQAVIADGILAEKEVALKGGSMGSVDTLEKMMCRCEVCDR